MKFTMRLLALIFGALMLVNTVYADSTREQLKQMAEQLQKTPTDNALREKIIKLAQKLKPAPAVPDEAERRMARGTAAFKGAKSVSDYQEAVKEFELATLAAPWYGDAYFNLGVAQDKAENYEAALRSLKLAQLTSPGSKEIKQLIYEVEYRKERESSPEVQAAKKKQQELEARRADEEMIHGLEGAIYDCPINRSGLHFECLLSQRLEIKGEKLRVKLQVMRGCSAPSGYNLPDTDYQLSGKIVRFFLADGRTESGRYEVAPEHIDYISLYGTGSFVCRRR